jgi:hypothetical protein
MLVMSWPPSSHVNLMENATDAWWSMPEATLPRWESMQQLVAQFAGADVRRMAVLGYPNPRAALRVVAKCPVMESVALVSPVPGFAERASALASRLNLATTVLSVQRSLWASELRANYFPVVIARVPIDASVVTVGLYATLTAHVLEAMRVSTRRALLILHLSVRVPSANDQEGAARLAHRVTHMLQGLGARHAYFAAAVVGPSRRTVDVVGWARRGGVA